MKTYRLQVDTYHKEEIIDVTAQIKEQLVESNIKSGYIILYVPHTTAAVTVNENTDPDVKSDMVLGLREAFPHRDDYKHYEGNTDAHIKSSVIGVSETILVEDGELVLGTWQGILFCEFDGPRSRKLLVKIIED